MKKHTTLRELRDHGACKPRYDYLVNQIGPDWGDEQELQISKILEHNGFEDTLWALRTCAELTPLIGAVFAEHVLPIFEEKYPGDDRPRMAIEAARSGNAYAAAYACADAAAYACARAADAAAYACARAAYAAAYACADAADASCAAYAADAAAYAACACARARAARAAEQQWQIEALRFMLS